MYDVKRMLKPESLCKEDVYRLVYWTRGFRAGYNEDDTTVTCPVEYMAEFFDGVEFGRTLYIMHHDKTKYRGF